LEQSYANSSKQKSEVPPVDGSTSIGAISYVAGEFDKITEELNFDTRPETLAAS
jgi:hypothetical protein